MATDHVYLRQEGLYWSRVVPLTCHEDAGPFSKSKSANCLSFSGFLCAGGEKVTKYLCCSNVKAKGLYTTSAWRELIRDFEGLADGIDTAPDL